MRDRAARLRAATRAGAIALVRPAKGEIAVSYGHRRLPAPGDPVEGGMVKFQRLQEALPHRPRDFNLLYLGSSSLPTDERSLIRLAKRRGAPVVLNQNGIAYPGWAAGRAEALNARLRHVLEAARHVVYQSAYCKDAADHFLGEPTVTWEILHNAVDTKVFTPGEPEPDGPVLLLGGDQTQEYRLRLGLETLALLPDARLLVTGTLVADPVALAREAGVVDRVEVVGRYAQRDAPSLFRRAHVLLHTKVSDPCPNVVLEAMASGVPVVYPASGGTQELVGEGGIGVPSDTSWERDVPPAPEDLAAAVREVLANHAAYRTAARTRTVDRFDLAPWIERHRVLFAELLS